jgi:hypothetical protein
MASLTFIQRRVSVRLGLMRLEIHSVSVDLSEIDSHARDIVDLLQIAQGVMWAARSGQNASSTNNNRTTIRTELRPQNI